MQFYTLTPLFFSSYAHCPEIEQKQTRPYYVLILKLNEATFAIPLRSHIRHPYAYIADGNESGLDFTKAVIITNPDFLSTVSIKIRQNEFDFLKQHVPAIEKRFIGFVRLYVKKIQRLKNNPALPIDNLCKYSTLQYFHSELGL